MNYNKPIRAMEDPMGWAKPRDIIDEEPTEAAVEPRAEELRLIEALLFAAAEPLDEKTLAARLPDGVDISAAMRRLQPGSAPRRLNRLPSASQWTVPTA